MKVFSILVLLGVLVFAVAGCGSGKKATGQYQYTVTLHNNVALGPITVTGTKTTAISNVKTGTLVRCKGGPSEKVPPHWSGANVGEGRSTPSGTGGSSRGMKLTHLENGTVTVSCTHSR